MYGSGRIGEIKAALERSHGVPVKALAEKTKLDALCEALQVTPTTLDHLIASNSPVLRTVKGHCFESYFDDLMGQHNVEVQEVGGDDAVDRIVNGHTLQLKTPTLAGTKDYIVQYKTHKTHGAKSEQESMDYYHSIGEFADFLVGLVSYNPLRVLFLSKGEIPRHPQSRTHILSPFKVTWAKNPALNAFHRLGIGSAIAEPTAAAAKPSLLPESSRIIGTPDSVILDTIINDANFRIWDMAIRGFAREQVFKDSTAAGGIKLLEPLGLRSARADKADHAVKTSSGYRFVQMKGVSTNNCAFSARDPVIATETQLTRGRVNDHPTQSRLYLVTDFDYLVLALDPPIVVLCQHAVGSVSKLHWEFYLIPTNTLETHHAMPHRLKSLQKFKYSELQQYKVTSWNSIDF